jgi:hypothetical protein
MNEHGIWIQDHESKAGLLWNSFRNSMATTSSPVMLFDLDSMITHINGLDTLANSHAEVDSVVKHMPNDKAPGPDGFNSLFLKKMLVGYQGGFLQAMH